MTLISEHLKHSTDQQVLEKYDVITKLFQYHRNILEEEKINRQSHWISHNARAMLTE